MSIAARQLVHMQRHQQQKSCFIGGKNVERTFLLESLKLWYAAGAASVLQLESTFPFLPS